MLLREVSLNLKVSLRTEKIGFALHESLIADRKNANSFTTTTNNEVRKAENHKSFLILSIIVLKTELLSHSECSGFSAVHPVTLLMSDL